MLTIIHSPDYSENAELNGAIVFLKLTSEFEGKRPASLDLFLNMLGLSEEDFEEIIQKHRVDPWDDRVMVQIGKKPHDFDSWQAKPALTSRESQKIVESFKHGNLNN